MNQNASFEKALTGMLPEELFLHLNLDKPFRSRQLFRWLAAGANSFDTMTNLPPALRIV